jgi:hypothetical protein
MQKLGLFHNATLPKRKVSSRGSSPLKMSKSSLPGGTANWRTRNLFRGRAAPNLILSSHSPKSVKNTSRKIETRSVNLKEFYKLTTRLLYPIIEILKNRGIDPKTIQKTMGEILLRPKEHTFSYEPEEEPEQDEEKNLCEALRGFCPGQDGSKDLRSPLSKQASLECLFSPRLGSPVPGSPLVSTESSAERMAIRIDDLGVIEYHGIRFRQFYKCQVQKAARAKERLFLYRIIVNDHIKKRKISWNHFKKLTIDLNQSSILHEDMEAEVEIVLDKPQGMVNVRDLATDEVIAPLDTLQNEIPRSVSSAMLSDVCQYLEVQDSNVYRLIVDLGQAPLRVKSEKGFLSVIPTSCDQHTSRRNIISNIGKKPKFETKSNPLCVPRSTLASNSDELLLITGPRRQTPSSLLGQRRKLSSKTRSSRPLNFVNKSQPTPKPEDKTTKLKDEISLVPLQTQLVVILGLKFLAVVQLSLKKDCLESPRLCACLDVVELPKDTVSPRLISQSTLNFPISAENLMQSIKKLINLKAFLRSFTVKFLANVVRNAEALNEECEYASRLNVFESLKFVAREENDPPASMIGQNGLVGLCHAVHETTPFPIVLTNSLKMLEEEIVAIRDCLVKSGFKAIPETAGYGVILKSSNGIFLWPENSEGHVWSQELPTLDDYTMLAMLRSDKANPKVIFLEVFILRVPRKLKASFPLPYSPEWSGGVMPAKAPSNSTNLSRRPVPPDIVPKNPFGWPPNSSKTLLDVSKGTNKVSLWKNNPPAGDRPKTTLSKNTAFVFPKGFKRAPLTKKMKHRQVKLLPPKANPTPAPFTELRAAMPKKLSVPGSAIPKIAINNESLSPRSGLTQRPRSFSDPAKISSEHSRPPAQPQTNIRKNSRQSHTELSWRKLKSEISDILPDVLIRLRIFVGDAIHYTEPKLLWGKIITECTVGLDRQVTMPDYRLVHPAPLQDSTTKARLFNRHSTKSSSPDCSRENKAPCQKCQRVKKKVYNCKKCSAIYCSRTCLKSDMKNHKIVCNSKNKRDNRLLRHSSFDIPGKKKTSSSYVSRTEGPKTMILQESEFKIFDKFPKTPYEYYDKWVETLYKHMSIGVNNKNTKFKQMNKNVIDNICQVFHGRVRRVLVGSSEHIFVASTHSKDFLAHAEVIEKNQLRWYIRRPPGTAQGPLEKELVTETTNVLISVLWNHNL